MTVPVGLIVVDVPATAGGFADLGQIAADAEAAGADAVWLTDHLYWHRPTVDVISGLAMAASSTTRCTIGPCALQLPLRDLPSTAKSLSFLDHLAPGRVIACVGVGEHEAEYIAAGKADRFRRRGRLLDEGIAALRQALHQHEAGLVMGPGGQVPIWVGGRSHHARQRAARLGDGWIPHLCRAPWFGDQMGLLADEIEAAERPATSVARAAAVAVFVDGIEPDTDPLAWMGRLYAMAPEAFARSVVRGSANEVAAEIHAFAEAGADQVDLVVAGDRSVDHLAAVLDVLNG